MITSEKLAGILTDIRRKNFSTVVSVGAVTGYLAWNAMALGILLLGTFHNFARAL